MTAFEQTYEWQLGRFGEVVVRDVCTGHGHLVLDTSALSPEAGHGPRVHGQGALLVPADLDVVLRPWGLRVLLQVKTKSNRGVMGRITREPEHGFSWLDFRRYRDLEKQFAVPVFVVVVEAPGWPALAEAPQILARRVSNLRPRGDCPTFNGGERMAYFPRSQLREDGIGHIERCAEATLAQRRRGLRASPSEQW